MADDLERPGGSPGHDESEPHSPSPTIWPAGFAAGVALVLIGLIVSWPAVAVGAGLAVVFGFLWVRDVTREHRRPAPPVEPRPAPVELEEEEEAEAPEHYPRSVFLERATLGLGAVIGGAVTVPAIGLAIGPAFALHHKDVSDIDLGPLDNFPEGQFLIVNFAFRREYHQRVVFRRTAFIRNNGIENGVPSFTILSNRCTHLGCPVQPNGPVQEPQRILTASGEVTLTGAQPAGFGCPCHGGAYDTEGNRTAGPPVRALDRYRYAIKNGRLVIEGRFSVGKVIGEGATAKIESYKLFGPGQHVDGPDAWMYPFAP